MLLVGLLIAVGLDLRAGSRCFANTGLRAAAYVVGSRGQGWQVSNKLPGCLPKLADTLAGVDWRYCSTSMSLMLHNCTDQALFSTGNGCKAIHDYTFVYVAGTLCKTLDEFQSRLPGSSDIWLLPV